MNIVALIPARGGSKRIPNKNVRMLAGHPLIAYTIAATKQSSVFSQIIVASDSEDILHTVSELDSTVTLYKRNPSHDDEPDIQWVSQVLFRLGATEAWDAFAILRPTSPFRSAHSIKEAEFWMNPDPGCSEGEQEYDSLRAVRRVAEHPAKMWRGNAETTAFEATPLLLQTAATPWHSMPTQQLPPVYVQTAGLEIAWINTVKRTGTIAGYRVLAYELTFPESLDINTEQDWWVAERAVAEGYKLPEVGVRMAAYSGSDPT